MHKHMAGTTDDQCRSGPTGCYRKLSGGFKFFKTIDGPRTDKKQNLKRIKT